jgi:hypothetical protein
MGQLSERARQILENLLPVGVSLEGVTPKTLQKLKAQWTPEMDQLLRKRIKGGQHGPYDKYAQHGELVASQ